MTFVRSFRAKFSNNKSLDWTVLSLLSRQETCVCLKGRTYCLLVHTAAV